MKNLKYISLCGYEGSPSKILSSQFWSRISPRNSLVSVNLLPDSLQSMNSPKKCHKLFEIQDLDKLLKSIRILHGMEGSNNITSTFKQSIQVWTGFLFLSQYVLSSKASFLFFMNEYLFYFFKYCLYKSCSSWNRNGL
jgi:hypothetical protein